MAPLSSNLGARSAAHPQLFYPRERDTVPTEKKAWVSQRADLDSNPGLSNP